MVCMRINKSSDKGGKGNAGSFNHALVGAITWKDQALEIGKGGSGPGLSRADTR